MQSRNNRPVFSIFAIATIVVVVLSSCSLLNPTTGTATTEHERLNWLVKALNNGASVGDLNTNMATSLMQTAPDQTQWDNLFSPSTYAPFSITTSATPTADTTTYSPETTTTETETLTNNSGATVQIKFWFVTVNGNVLIRAFTYNFGGGTETTYKNIQ